MLAARTVWHQLGRFLVVGSLNAVVDFTAYITLTRGFTFWSEHFLFANALAFFIANLHSFVWNRHWTFTATSPRPLRQYLGFLGVSLVYLAFIQLGLWLLVTRLGLYDLVGKAVVVGLAVCLYFGALKRKVFWREPGAQVPV